MRTWILGAVGAAVLATGASAQALRPDQVEFRALYKELVETNTTLSSGSCTLASERMAARLKAAGFTDDQLTLFATPEHPKDGGLVAILPGTSKTAKPMLLLAHLDVVEAKREDWTRDPFTLVEEDGRFYARGAADDKSMAAIWADLMVRFKASGYKPKRTIKMALTCGEETTYAFNGVDWLAKNRPDLVASAFALNEGGGGVTDGKGKLVEMGWQVGEKSVENFRIETTNPGGHSSIPVRENAIYDLADALVKVRGYTFPLQLSDTTRTYFAKTGASRHDAIGAAMSAIAKDPADKAAEAVLSADRGMNSTLRTTCVATLLDGGHANNALPQRAGANINCRVFPGTPGAQTQATLQQLLGPNVKITRAVPIRPAAIAPPLDPKLMVPADKLAAKYFPGIPLIPAMSTGGTDAVFLAALGIPVYGVPGLWGNPDGDGVHGLNEFIEVKSLYTGRDYLTDLVKIYAETP
jgi:acetylornithine deacetylase/succinyl-diaminopimelate desuccinylase-like protein